MSKPATSKTPMTCQKCMLWAGVLTLGTCLWERSKVYGRNTWNWERTPCVSPLDKRSKALLGEDK